jgi:hypothetical protein
MGITLVQFYKMCAFVKYEYKQDFMANYSIYVNNNCYCGLFP